MKNSQIAATQLSLPKGGGAIQGIGETFQSNEFTGTAALSIPIPTTPCRGFEPQLSVEYSSGGGNGIFGLGFNLSIPNISRKTSKGIPQYNESDIFLFSNAEDLVPIIDGEPANIVNGYKIITYRPRLEGLFAKIERWVNEKTQDSYWQVVSNDNVTSIFGKTEKARIFDPEDPKRIFQWLLQETFDAKGNRIVYEYEGENSDNVRNNIYEKKYENNRCQTANKYIQKIKYGNVQPFQPGQVSQDNWLFEVVFDYGEYAIDPNSSYEPIQYPKLPNRQDSFSTYHAGFEIRTHRLCRRILMFHNFQKLDKRPTLVHATCFNYQESAIVSLLNKVESVGYRYEQGNYQQKTLPPLEFKYTNFDTNFDTNKQGFLPLQEAGETGRDLPGLHLPPDYQLIDLYGEGIPGVLYSDGQATLYWEP
ncbi:MAG: SpvB/TcaC N-terminal domain-containing protein, partial [Gloeotrichia echinulata HAB0833]